MTFSECKEVLVPCFYLDDYFLFTPRLANEWSVFVCFDIVVPSHASEHIEIYLKTVQSTNIAAKTEMGWL
jgi:hypothetical protein